MGWLGWDWGAPVPDYLVAIGTVGALGGTVWTVLRDHQDRRKQRQYERASQARQVRVGSVTPVGGAVTSRGEKVDCTYTVILTNHSEDIIHDVTLSLRIVPADAAFPGTAPLAVLPRDVLPAKEDISVTLRASLAWSDVKQDAVDHRCDVEAHFTDINGQRWMRGPDYRLRPV